MRVEPGRVEKPWGCELIWTETACDIPEASTLHVDDAVGLDDRYGRAGTEGGT